MFMHLYAPGCFCWIVCNLVFSFVVIYIIYGIIRQSVVYLSDIRKSVASFLAIPVAEKISRFRCIDLYPNLLSQQSPQARLRLPEFVMLPTQVRVLSSGVWCVRYFQSLYKFLLCSWVLSTHNYAFKCDAVQRRGVFINQCRRALTRR